jgi:hypothetical protein
VKRHYVVAVVLLAGLVVLGAGLAPSVGCDRAYAIDATAEPTGSDPVVNASVLPADVRDTVRQAATTGERATISQADYKTHLEDRRVGVAGTAYAFDLAVVESCGGALEDGLVVVGTALSMLGSVALVLLVLYRDELGPPLGVLHLAAAIALVLGATLFAGGIAAPAGCVDNYALETTEIPGGENATDETVVDVSVLPLDLANATERSVDTNQTAFVDRSTYREHLENRSVRYDGTVYDADIVLVQDCGGGFDDALLVGGLVFATLGAVALALLITFDHGEKVL